MSGDQPFYLSQNHGFAPIDATAELLHPRHDRPVTADSLTETQYFGFSVPEHGIHALTYLWHRPNLHLVTGGVWVWSGIRQTMVESEICDMRTFMNDSALKNDLHDYRLENSYGVKILEPLKRFHVTYSDPARNNSIDLLYEAVSPAVMFGEGNHFEQAMQVKGKLVLRGKQYDVDCFNVRDRSWGKPRPEDPMPVPPMSWMTGVFNKDFSFNCTALDQASGNPELTGQFALPEERTLMGGWINRDGRVGRIVRVKKRIARAPASLFPIAIELEMTDEFDRNVHVRGAMVAASQWQGWHNVNVCICLIRWECEGLIGYGDCQDAKWGDYYNFIRCSSK